MRGKKITALKMMVLSFFVMCMAFMVSTTDVQAAPGKVIGVKQVDSSATSVKVQWNAVLGSNIKYDVEYSLDNKSWVKENSYSLSSPQEYIFYLTSGSTYYVRVRAYTETYVSGTGYVCDYGAYSDSIEVVTKPEFASGAKITQTNATASSISLNWTAAPGANLYEVYIKDGVNYPADYYYAGTTTTNSITIPKLTSGWEYTVEVIAGKKAVSTGYVCGNDYIYQYDMKTLPGKVTGVHNNYLYKKTLCVGCDKIQNADGYEMTVFDYKGKGKVKTIKVNSYNYDYMRWTKAKKNKSYVVQVRAYTTINGVKKYGASSSKVNVVAQPQVSGKRSSSKISFSWDKVQGATGYDIYMSTKRDTGYKKVKSVSAKTTKYSTTKFKNKKLSKNKTYYLYVTAKRKVGRKTYKSVPYAYYIAW